MPPLQLPNFYRGKKVLVTGHSGFKGAWLSQILLNWGAEVVGISLPPNTDPSLFSILQLQSRMRSYFIDIRNYEGVEAIFRAEQPEIVFHLAAQPIVRVSYDEPLRTVSTNVLGTTYILEIIRQLKTVKSAVIITTDKVYKDNNWTYPYREIDPLGGYDPYSGSKAAADIVIQAYTTSYFNPAYFQEKHCTLVAIARAGNVIGGGDWAAHRLVPDIVRAVYQQDIPVEIRYPQAVRPWEHVLEPLSGYLLLGQGLYEGKTPYARAWNFGPHEESFATVETLARTALGILGKGQLQVAPDPSKHETNILKLDISEAKTHLHWSPTLQFEQNLNYTFGWYKHFYQQKTDMITFTDQQINSFFKQA
jgi:CDP-glucose 4,6-dehydratase